MPKKPTSSLPHPDGARSHPIDDALADRVAAMDDPVTTPAPRSPPQPSERDAIIAQGKEARGAANEQVDAALSGVAASPRTKAERKAALTSLPPDILAKPKT